MRGGGVRSIKRDVEKLAEGDKDSVGNGGSTRQS